MGEGGWQVALSRIETLPGNKRERLSGGCCVGCRVVCRLHADGPGSRRWAGTSHSCGECDNRDVDRGILLA